MHLYSSIRWEKLNELEPSNVDAYNGMATALFLREDYEKCEKVLLEGFKLHPKNVNLAFNLGNLYYRTKQYGLAVHYLEITLEIDPTYRNTQNLRDKALERAKFE